MVSLKTQIIFTNIYNFIVLQTGLKRAERSVLVILLNSFWSTVQVPHEIVYKLDIRNHKRVSVEKDMNNWF